MNRIANEKGASIFGALKLIEQLYLDGEIPGYVLRNILKDYESEINITSFNCNDDAIQQEVKKCMD